MSHPKIVIADKCTYRICAVSNAVNEKKAQPRRVEKRRNREIEVIEQWAEVVREVRAEKNSNI